MAVMTNANWLDIAIKTSPNFNKWTSKGTEDFFTEQGWEALKAFSPDAENEFFGGMLRVVFQQMSVSTFKDHLLDKGFGETYDTKYGAYIQRKAIESIKPITPQYRGLKEGDSVNPWVVRPPKHADRFFQRNFDYQSLVTIQDFNLKEIFLSDYGISEMVGAITKALGNGWGVQRAVNKLEIINEAINSTNWPLQDSQKCEVEVATINQMTDEELINFVLSVKKYLSQMDAVITSKAYNAYHFETHQDKSRLKMLMRPGIKDEINVRLRRLSYNPEDLELGIDIIEVSNFGGLEPYKEAEFTTKLYPSRNKFGEVVGYNETADGSVDTYPVTVETYDVFWKDPNENVIAVIADKGVIFETITNPLETRPIINPASLTQNIWVSAPNNAINYDPLYTLCIVTQKS